MGDPLNPFEFAAFLGARWRLFTIACGVAVALSAVISVLLPKRYTATASVLISPPAGNDPRAVTSVSPIYLESLRAYERVALSDTLFLRASDQFNLRREYADTPVENLKRQILTVTKPVNMEILEISVTLGDPKTAQAFAEFIAAQTCATSHSFDLSLEDELAAAARLNLDRAQARLGDAERARNTKSGTQAISASEEKLWNAGELRSRIEDDLTSARTQLADSLPEQALSPASNEEDREVRQAAAARAKIKTLENQDRAVTAQLEAEGAALEKRRSDREALESEWKAAQAEVESAKSKLNDIAASSAFRGERLRIIDPGIVPQQPSSPNLWLNIAAALLVSLIAAFVFAAVEFSRRLQARRTEREYSFH